jgi:predicted phosphate transport protein (TIGR00153 family)
MSWLKNFLKPRQDNFLKLLIQQAEFAVKGFEALLTFMQTGDGDAAKMVGRYEKDADEVRRILVDELNRTFVTPMDREDIFALSRAVDDILDYAYSTVDEMTVLNIAPNPHLTQMTSLLRDAANEVHLAMQRLKDHPRVATDHAQRAKTLENRVEAAYREAIAHLFDAPSDVEHIVEMLKLREVYRHLSNAADRGDEAANIINDIVIKMT